MEGARSWTHTASFFSFPCDAFFFCFSAPNNEGGRALTYSFVIWSLAYIDVNRVHVSSYLQPRRKVVRVSHMLAVIDAQDGRLEHHGACVYVHSFSYTRRGEREREEEREIAPARAE